MVKPSPFAALRMMANSNFVGCSIGRSAGLAPLRTLAINARGTLSTSPATSPNRWQAGPAVNPDPGPGCIRATHFGKNDSLPFSSLRDPSAPVEPWTRQEARGC